MAVALAAALLTPVQTADSAQADALNAPAHHFVLVGAGRFAVLADLNTLSREGDNVRIRALQVSEAPFEIGGKSYWGGWSWWRFDCTTHMADRLDFASLRDNAVEGPVTPEPSPPYLAAKGGDADELLTLACADVSERKPDALSLADALKLGRAAVSGELDPPH